MLELYSYCYCNNKYLLYCKVVYKEMLESIFVAAAAAN